jgi:hypothetical protein
MPDHHDRRAGANLRDRGLSLAAADRQRQIAGGQVAMIDALLRSPDGTGTTDAAVADLNVEWSDGGKWRGAIPRALAHRGLIGPAGFTTSARTARREGPVRLWRLLDRAGLHRERDRLTAWLASNPPPARQFTGDLFAGVAR